MYHQVVWEQNGVYSKFSGIVSAEDIYDSDHELYKDPRFNFIQYSIYDFTDTFKLDMNEVHLDIAAAKDNGKSLEKENLKLIFITKDEKIKQQIEHYCNTSRRLYITWKFEIFETLDDAREWLSN